jgi:type II secretion system protein C
MTANQKLKFITLANWLVIGLIILLWLQFSLKNDAAFDSGINVSTSSINQTPQKIESIAQYHIFGSAQQLIEVPLSRGNTNLALVLNGTMSKQDVTTGTAYISNTQGEQKKFKVGDKVFNLATLTEIYKDFVILEHSGKKERLALSEKVQRSVVSKKPKSNKNTNSNYLKHLNGSEQRNWQELMQQQKFDPGKISAIVGSVNLVTDQAGQIQGLRVSNLAQSDLLTKKGLRSNDIITAINGNKVSAKNMLVIKETLQQNPNATVTVKRNGKIQNIKISINDL